MGSNGGGEALSPAGKLFHSPSLNCYVIAVMGCKTSINPQVIKEGLCQTLLKHPRFSSKLVKKKRRRRWIPTRVNLDDHVTVPEIDSNNIEYPDRFVEDYISNFTKTPLDLSKPLWELHILNIKTSDAEAVGVFRIHHSLGDGASLISLLLAATRKTSDPDALPTVPTHKRRTSYHSSTSFLWPFFAIWWGLILIWHTVLDMALFVLTTFFIKDTPTPLKGAPGVELNTKRFVHRTVSLDDIKLIKNEMKTTINDVLLGITQAGLARYLNKVYAGLDANSDGVKHRSIILKKIRLRAAILVNIRPVAGIQDLADMMAESSKAKWGNWMGYIILPFSIALHDDPLEYVRQAKATIDRKKHSLEAICSYVCAKLILNLFGVKVAAAITRRVLFNTTIAFSNVPGPVEEISFYGHPAAYIAPSVYGHPQALTIHFQSYADKMTICLALDPLVIPDPYLLCDDLEHSFKLILDAVKKRNIENVI
ncbi:hypothetical protein RJT34_11727 [Clitoria ternatea]|uniref:Diacylglycerol O-acyltransferase n=1 Tax=Clitoria ternatea TaxID=43366 RepID=A0AAN9PJT4_CLITE